MEFLKKSKQLTALFLSMLMVASCIPETAVFAAEPEEITSAEEVSAGVTADDEILEAENIEEEVVEENQSIEDQMPYLWDGNRLQYTADTVSTPYKSLVIAAANTPAPMPEKGEEGYPWEAEIQDVIQKLTIKGSITDVPANAFYGYPSLKTVLFEGGGCSIGESAFENCGELYSFNAYANNKTDYTIGASAFKGDSNFQSIWVNYEYLTAIGESAFEGTALVGIDLDKTSITAIPANAFKDIKPLTRIMLSDKITSVGNYAFAGDTGLTRLTFKSDTISFGSHVF